MREVRNSIHLDFDWNRDLLLYLLGGPAGPLRDDGGVVVRDVGICLDGQVMKGDGSPGERHDRERQHHEPVVEGKIYEGANHVLFTARSCAPGSTHSRPTVDPAPTLT